MNRSFALPAVLIGSLLGVGSIACVQAAAPSDEVPSVKMYFAKAELLDHAGIARIHQRLKAAAGSVCSEYESRELARRAVYNQCVAEALARAVAQIHDPALTAYDEQRTGYLRQIPAINGTQAAAP